MIQVVQPQPFTQRRQTGFYQGLSRAAAPQPTHVLFRHNDAREATFRRRWRRGQTRRIRNSGTRRRVHRALHRPSGHCRRGTPSSRRSVHAPSSYGDDARDQRVGGSSRRAAIAGRLLHGRYSLPTEPSSAGRAWPSGRFFTRRALCYSLCRSCWRSCGAGCRCTATPSSGRSSAWMRILELREPKRELASGLVRPTGSARPR